MGYDDAKKFSDMLLFQPENVKLILRYPNQCGYSSVYTPVQVYADILGHELQRNSPCSPVKAMKRYYSQRKRFLTRKNAMNAHR
uniref:Uncharacterized protein n=1 Tax=Physcomitrium patens TaxID=3218 RepID=A0A2K1JG95_PHYPA|nr:hypothetical protein PHYPA_017975 [Physcomitrium patens]